MAARSRTSYQKRQKELARIEKQRDKAAKRLERKQGKQSSGLGSGEPADAEFSPSEPIGTGSGTVD